MADATNPPPPKGARRFFSRLFSRKALAGLVPRMKLTRFLPKIFRRKPKAKEQPPAEQPEAEEPQPKEESEAEAEEVQEAAPIRRYPAAGHWALGVVGREHQAGRVNWHDVTRDAWAQSLTMQQRGRVDQDRLYTEIVEDKRKGSTILVSVTPRIDLSTVYPDPGVPDFGMESCLMTYPRNLEALGAPTNQIRQRQCAPLHVSSIAISDSDVPFVLTTTLDKGCTLAKLVVETVDPHWLGQRCTRSAYPHFFANYCGVFDSHFAPKSTRARFALGTQRGLLIGEANGADVTRFLRCTDQAVLSTRWQSKTVVAAGLRNGSIILVDIRSRGAVRRLQFPSAVARLRPLDTHYILAAGLHDQMHLYDQRFTPAPTGFRPHPSPPLISFLDYRNRAYRRLGFDVSTALGLVAAAGDDGSVRLFGLDTGRVVDSTLDARPAGPLGVVASLAFVRDGKAGNSTLLGHKKPGILMTGRSVVEEWTVPMGSGEE